MVLLTGEHIAKSYTEKPLLRDINISIHENDKTGLVGVNGSGKSTLLKIIAGEIEAEGGTITRNNQLKTAYLAQNPEYDPKLTVIEQAMTYAGADIPEYMCRSMLNKAGMENHDKKMTDLSGGERKRVALAAVMVKDSNLLILDEPTNHMDNDIIEWLEEQLILYKGAVFMITHDRYFLERVTDKICEIENGRLITYEGNYDKYLQMKAERQEMALASERKRAAIYKKELRWIRWSAPARTTKARGRIERFKQLEESKLEIEDPHLEIGTSSSRLGKKIIELKNITKGYGDRVLIRDFSYMVLRNDRIGIVGPNGCGKTTLLRLIMGQEMPDSGSIEIGGTVKIGYFSQESTQLDPEKRIIKYIEEISDNVKIGDGYLSASQMLERFLFSPHMHSVQIGRLSGGEKRRLYLLSILMQAPNVLIFDEPTNDLDIDTLTVLEDYLDDFPGAVIIVSHDRYFLDRLAIRTFGFEENGNIKHYIGGYSSYANDRERRQAEAANARKNKVEESVSKKADGRNQKPKKLKFSYKEQREYEAIEEDIERIESEIKGIEEEILEYSSDFEKLAALSEQKDALDMQLLEKLERWEYLSDLAARIENGETE